jgi:hypothetical protein
VKYQLNRSQKLDPWRHAQPFKGKRFDHFLPSRCLTGWAVAKPRTLWAWAGFWSLTVYNKEHLIEPNPPNRFSLGTESKSMKQNSNGSLALYFQNTSPGSDKESNRAPTPTDEFSLYTRACWPKEYRLRQTSDSGKMSANVQVFERRR